MNERVFLLNPLGPSNSGSDAEALTREYLCSQPYSKPISLQEGLLVAMENAIEMTRVISQCLVSDTLEVIDRAGAGAQGIHDQENVLTAGLVSPSVTGQVLRGAIELPGALGRIGDKLESILSCCRIKAQKHVPFSERAHADLDQLFEFLLEMMTNVHGALVTPSVGLLAHTVSRGNEVSLELHGFRLFHWVRLKSGFCAPQASPLYLDLLDSVKTINEYLAQFCVTLLELGTASGVMFRKLC